MRDGYSQAHWSTETRWHDPNGVIFTYTDIKGMFVDAVERGNPPNGQIVAYRITQEGDVHAIIRNSSTGQVSVYAMDVETRSPKIVLGIRIRRKKIRPRWSREFKMMMAEQRWKEDR